VYFLFFQLCASNHPLAMGVPGLWQLLQPVTKRVHFLTLVEPLRNTKPKGTPVTVVVDGYYVLYEVLAEFAEVVLMEQDLSGYAIFFLSFFLSFFL
jgi:hypothetical protein